jgi:putative ABC transport system ATP-binding protein
MIKLIDIGKSYDLGAVKVAALEGVSLEIEKGDYVAVMGPSGSGKSTFLNILGILERPTDGTYELEGYDITRLPDREQARIRNKHFGFVFQSFNLFAELSAMENVMLPMGYAGVAYNDRKKRAAELLDTLGLADRLHHLPSMMSGGEQQRVAIARALANEPDLILADEPTGNLPSEKGEQILEILEDLNRQGVTVLMVTHNDKQGKRAKHAIRLMDGKLVNGSNGNGNGNGGSK